MINYEIINDRQLAFERQEADAVERGLTADETQRLIWLALIQGQFPPTDL